MNVTMTRDYVAFVHGPDGFLRDVYAANNMVTLTMITQAVRLAGDTVRFSRMSRNEYTFG